LVEDADDLTGPNAAFEPTKDKNPVNPNKFHIEDSNRQNEISVDEDGIHLTNLELLDHEKKGPVVCSQSRTSDTNSTDRESIAAYNGSLQLTELFTAREKPFNIEPTSHQLKTFKKSDFCTAFLNLTKKYFSFVAEGPHTIDVPNDQVLRGHNVSPHGNVSTVNVLLGAYYTRADRHHALMEGTPQWVRDCSNPMVVPIL